MRYVEGCEGWGGLRVVRVVCQVLERYLAGTKRFGGTMRLSIAEKRAGMRFQRSTLRLEMLEAIDCKERDESDGGDGGDGESGGSGETADV